MLLNYDELRYRYLYPFICKSQTWTLTVDYVISLLGTLFAS